MGRNRVEKQQLQNDNFGNQIPLNSSQSQFQENMNYFQQQNHPFGQNNKLIDLNNPQNQFPFVSPQFQQMNIQQQQPVFLPLLNQFPQQQGIGIPLGQPNLQFIQPQQNQQNFNGNFQIEMNNNLSENNDNDNILQDYSKISQQELDRQIKNQEDQIELLKKENDQLLQEIQEFNQKAVQAANPFQIPVANPNNQQGEFEEKNPEIAYCTVQIGKRKHFTPGDLTSYGLAYLLQKILTHMKLDYSAIDVKGKANLFKKDFVTKEIINKLVMKNTYLNRETIEGSKPVYCVNYFHKQLQKYSTICLGVQSVWFIVLSIVYILCEARSYDSTKTLNCVVYALYLIYFIIENSMIYFGMKNCSVMAFQTLQVMAMINIFLTFIVTSISMGNIHGGGFQLQAGLIVIFVFNAITMFMQMFMLALFSSFPHYIKRMLAVVVQIPSTELAS